MTKTNSAFSQTDLTTKTRRLFIVESGAAVLVCFLPSCGGSSPTTNSSQNPSSTTLSIASLSSSMPVALTPISVKVAGLDPSQPFMVSLTDPSGNSIPQTVIRAQSDGTIVFPAPIHLDASTGTTSPLQTMLVISQNGQSVTTPLTISDIPQLSDFGVPLGMISRAFYIHQAISLGASVNSQQALSGTPGIVVNNSTLTSNLQAQLKNIILARNDLDRIVSDSTVQIPAGTAPDGTPIYFNAASVELMDRIIGQYLLVYTPGGANGAINTGHVRVKGETLGAGTISTIIQAITTVAGAASYKTTQQSLTDPSSSTLDGALSFASTAASLVTVGSSIIALGAATVAGAPVIAAGFAAVATYSALLGVLVSSASVGNDLYNVATNGYMALIEPSGSQAQMAALNGFEQAGASLTVDTVTAFLNAEGVGGLVNSSIIGPAASSVLKGIFNPAAQDLALASAGLLSSVDSLLIATAFSSDGTAAAGSVSSLSPATNFSQVDGGVSISNSQGPILSGLPAVGAGNSSSGTNQFTTITDPSGTYSLVLPLGDPSLTYSSVSISAYDPVTGLTLASSVVDLSSLTPNSIVAGPILSGSCNDSDAGTPDGDDPDCD